LTVAHSVIVDDILDSQCLGAGPRTHGSEQGEHDGVLDCLEASEAEFGSEPPRSVPRIDPHVEPGGTEELGCFRQCIAHRRCRVDRKYDPPERHAIGSHEEPVGPFDSGDPDFGCRGDVPAANCLGHGVMLRVAIHVPTVRRRRLVPSGFRGCHSDARDEVGGSLHTSVWDAVSISWSPSSRSARRSIDLGEVVAFIRAVAVSQ